MSYDWELSDSAKDEASNQMQWYEENVFPDGAALADRWLAKLHQAFDKLAKAPLSFGPAPENGKWLPTLQVRQMLFRPWKSGAGWRVLFVVDEEAKRVTILQVRHEHRRWMHEGEV